jgi:hypothetical protein
MRARGAQILSMMLAPHTPSAIAATIAEEERLQKMQQQNVTPQQLQLQQLQLQRLQQEQEVAAQAAAAQAAAATAAAATANTTALGFSFFFNVFIVYSLFAFVSRCGCWTFARMFKAAHGFERGARKSRQNQPRKGSPTRQHGTSHWYVAQSGFPS